MEEEKKMLNNLDYFKLGTEHKEGLIDPNYHSIVDRNVIPPTIDQKNALTISNEKVIRYVSSIETMTNELKKSIDDPQVVNVLKLIIEELKTQGMNYSAFCQYFNVHNMNYSIFQGLSQTDKIEVLKFIIEPYIKTRHDMYVSHGYSNIVLQVMSDNYSHKRKGTYGTNKIADILKLLGIPDLAKEKYPSFRKETYYLLSDKTGKTLYKKFAAQYGVSLSSEDRQTEKYPDALIKIGTEFYIVEQKNMKENGGGQDKQASEITDFIFRNPEFDHLHYVTFIDGIYFNQIDKNAHAKTLQQYTDIISALAKFKSNYFVNSYAFKRLLQDSLTDNACESILSLLKDNY